MVILTLLGELKTFQKEGMEYGEKIASPRALAQPRDESCSACSIEPVKKEKKEKKEMFPSHFPRGYSRMHQNPERPFPPAFYPDTRPDKAQQHQLVRHSLLTYFGDLDLIKERQQNHYGIYVAQVYCGVCARDRRYVFVIVPQDRLPIGSETNLRNLAWVSLQARTLTEDRRLPVQEYPAHLDTVTQTRIVLTEEFEERYRYRLGDLPVQVEMILPKRSLRDYPAEAPLSASIESFNTVINLI